MNDNRPKANRFAQEIATISLWEPRRRPSDANSSSVIASHHSSFRVHCPDILHSAPAVRDSPDLPERFSLPSEQAFDNIKIALPNNQHHANAHVERAQHIVLWNLAVLSDKLKDRLHGPASKLNVHPASNRQNARRVFRKAAARYVDDTLEQMSSALSRPVAPALS